MCAAVFYHCFSTQPGSSGAPSSSSAALHAYSRENVGVPGLRIARVRLPIIRKGTKIGDKTVGSPDCW